MLCSLFVFNVCLFAGFCCNSQNLRNFPSVSLGGWVGLENPVVLVVSSESVCSCFGSRVQPFATDFVWCERKRLPKGTGACAVNAHLCGCLMRA